MNDTQPGWKSACSYGGDCVEVRWQSACTGTATCVEVSPGLLPGWYAMRDSKDPDGPTLEFDSAELDAFAKAWVAGEFQPGREQPTVTGQQSGPAGRIATAEAFAALWRKTFAKTQLSLMGLEPALTLETLEATLQALADARQQLAGLKTVWASIYSDGEYATKDEALAAASKDRFGASAVDEDVCWRLVGDWHEASDTDEKEQP